MSSISEYTEKIYDNIKTKEMKENIFDTKMKNNLKRRIDITYYYQTVHAISIFEKIKSKVVFFDIVRIKFSYHL